MDQFEIKYVDSDATLRFRDVEAGSNWLAKTSIALEAGQLEGLAERARAYFG